MASPTTIKAFFQSSGIPVLLPSEGEYTAVSTYYSLTDPKVPLALVRPRNADDVSLAVKYAIQTRLRIIVRSGGGDLYGRSQATDALIIDMRQICHVELDAHQRTARVGGGCNVGQVAGYLAQHCYATPCPPVPEIVAAKLVNCDGDLVDADEELLKSIRGGGGNFGVIVELSIKVYPLKKMLGGIVAFEASDLAAAFQSYIRAENALIQDGIPPALGLQVAAVNTDGGRLFGVLFVWSSDDHELGYRWLDKVAASGKEQMRTVTALTMREWQEDVSKLVPYGIYGYATTVSVRSITEQIAQVIGTNLTRMPLDKATSFSWHELRPEATGPALESVLLPRETHHVLELLSLVTDPTLVEESEAWCERFRAELLQCDDILPSNAIALTRPAHTTLQRLYGANLEELMRLKKKYDPKGTFDLAVPRLG